MLPSQVSTQICDLVLQHGKSGASRRLDIPLGTIRRVVNGAEQIRVATLLLIETRLRELSERSGL